MASTPKKKGLGRGLSALLSAAEPPVLDPLPKPEAGPQQLPDGSRLLWLDPAGIRPNPKQPRQVFDEETLAELAGSIKRDGLQEPVIVRESKDGAFELISGERRVRASVMAEIGNIPAVCRDIPDSDLLKLGLIENIQREDLNAIELAEAYQQLLQECGWTQEQLAGEIGKKRATVTNTLRLLQLSPPVRDMVADNSLAMGHARALLAIADPDKQFAAARKVAAEGLSVRQTEKLAAAATAPRREPASPAPRDPNIVMLEDELRRALGAKVVLRANGPDRGKIEIEYYTLDDLDRILGVMRGKGA